MKKVGGGPKYHLIKGGDVNHTTIAMVLKGCYLSTAEE